MKKIIIGIMGPGEGATSNDLSVAFELGAEIASRNWVLLTGGRNVGVMHEASKGAKSKNGLTIGILPSEDKVSVSDFVDIPIITGMGNARNNINVLSSEVLIICGNGPGTLSEIGLGMKANKYIIGMNIPQKSIEAIENFSGSKIILSSSVKNTIELIISIIKDY